MNKYFLPRRVYHHYADKWRRPGVRFIIGAGHHRETPSLRIMLESCGDLSASAWALDEETREQMNADPCYVGERVTFIGTHNASDIGGYCY
jgi:hypothetical protein